MKIPYNIFFLVWSILGIIILGIGFINDLFISDQFELGRKTFLESVWFIVFIIYIYNYYKYKIQKR